MYRIQVGSFNYSECYKLTKLKFTEYSVIYLLCILIFTYG